MAAISGQCGICYENRGLVPVHQDGSAPEHKICSDCKDRWVNDIGGSCPFCKEVVVQDVFEDRMRALNAGRAVLPEARPLVLAARNNQREAIGKLLEEGNIPEETYRAAIRAAALVGNGEALLQTKLLRSDEDRSLAIMWLLPNQMAIADYIRNHAQNPEQTRNLAIAMAASRGRKLAVFALIEQDPTDGSVACAIANAAPDRMNLVKDIVDEFCNRVSSAIVFEAAINIAKEAGREEAAEALIIAKVDNCCGCTVS
jgi:hypothetical protein